MKKPKISTISVAINLLCLLAVITMSFIITIQRDYCTCTDSIDEALYDSAIAIGIGIMTIYISFLFLLSNVKSFSKLIYAYMVERESLYMHFLNIFVVILFLYVMKMWCNYLILLVIMYINILLISYCVLYEVRLFLKLTTDENICSIYIYTHLSLKIARLNKKYENLRKIDNRIRTYYRDRMYFSETALFSFSKAKQTYDVTIGRDMYCRPLSLLRSIQVLDRLYKLFKLSSEYSIIIYPSPGELLKRHNLFLSIQFDKGKKLKRRCRIATQVAYLVFSAYNIKRKYNMHLEEEYRITIHPLMQDVYSMLSESDDSVAQLLVDLAEIHGLFSERKTDEVL